MDDGVWAETVHRLDQRVNPKWDSLSWIALRPLISAINDRVNSLAPRLVLDLRALWLARVAGHTGYEGVADRTGVSSFILMGDSGEQDASQYVVTPALDDALNSPGPAQPQFVIVCSDVIYPSGDLNDYVHGWYLPYERLLQDTAADGGPRLYGLPGNHDWYDGLTGFMNAHTGQDELDASAYGWPDRPPAPTVLDGAGWRRTLRLEGVGRVLWRRPSAPMAVPLHRGDRPRTPPQLRAAMIPVPAPGTAQPGPYFAVRLANGVTLVSIDGGIGRGYGASAIDQEQGRWLIDLSRRVPGPKVLLTGYPLLVNGEWKLCLIDGAAEARARGEWDGPTTVGELVARKEFGYIAAIGGDIHNFQHYQVAVGGEQDGHTVTYLVSGGGGAYIKATHTVQTAAHYKGERSSADDTAIRAANARRGGPPRPEDDWARAAGQPVDPAVTADSTHRALGPLPSVGDHAMIPSPPASLSHFTDQVLPMTWRFIRLMICFAAGGLAGAAIGERAASIARPALWATLLLVALAGAVRAVWPALAPPRRTMHSGRTHLHQYRAAVAVVAALAGAGSALTAWQLDALTARRYLGAWAVITVVGGVLGTLQRRSGWWREHGLEQRPPLRPGGKPRSTDLLGSSIAWGLLTLALAAAALVVLFGWGPRVIWLGAAGLVLVTVAIIGWRVRERPWWRTWSKPIAAAAQLTAAFLVFTAVPGPDAALRPLAVLAGVAFDVVLVLLVTPAVIAGLLGLARIVAGRNDWRAAVGRWGFVVPPSIGLACLVVLTGLTLLPGIGAADFLRVALSSAWAVAITVFGVFAVDWLRRNYPGSYRWIATPVLAILIALALWGQAQGAWLGTGLVLMTIGTALTIISVSTYALAFLGGHNLFFDWPSHQDREDRGDRPLISLEQAQDVLRWRQTSLGGALLDRTIRNRSKFVFPSTDQPHGVIQASVSEFFSSDRPPFFQHFLRIQVTEDALEVTPQVVTGLTPVPADTRPTIRIPLNP